VRGAQIILSVLTVFLIFIIGRKVNRAVGLLAAVAYALYPTAIWASALILTETLYIFLFMLYVYLFLQAMDRGSDKWTLASGIALGLATLVRPSVLPLVIMPIVYFILVRRIQEPIRLTLFSLVGFVLVMMPWWIRNIVTLNQIVLTATQAGNPLLAGTDPYFSIGDKLFENIANIDQKALAIDRIKAGFASDPYIWTAWFTVGKIRFMLRDLWVMPHGTFFDAFQHIHQWSVYLGFAAVLLYRKIRAIRPLIWFVLIPTGLQLLFLPLTRYGFPVMPLLMILGATVVVYLIGNWKENDDGLGYSSNYSGL
jgi:4-amino-4-deoxy-L-arabinose transferase-like glycosyltransferase